jgi:hypothetical protein
MRNTIKRIIDGKEITIELTTAEIMRLHDNFVYANLTQMIEDELEEREIEISDSRINAIAKNALDRIVGNEGEDSLNFQMGIINEEIDEELNEQIDIELKPDPMDILFKRK